MKTRRRFSSEARYIRITAGVGVLLWFFYSTSILLRATQNSLFVGPEKCNEEAHHSLPHGQNTLRQNDSKGRNFFVPKRILLGVMSADFANEFEIRQEFRKLFGMFSKHNDTRVCSLGNFMAQVGSYHGCQLVYTFVLGGNPAGPTELVNSSMPLLIPKGRIGSIPGIQADDKYLDDMTFLNIQENMKEGKSQTWLYRAQQLIERYDFDYVGKCDSDSVLDLVRLLEFTDEYLPPKPYNIGTIVGKPCDKLWWKMWRKSPARYSPDEKKAKEGFLRDRYGKVSRFNLIFHIYALGQFYMLSPDLVDVVVHEASTQQHKAYIEGNEDHDISTMAFHSRNPIRFVFLSELDMQFWQHPVKLKKNTRSNWERTWKQAEENLTVALSQRNAVAHV